MISANPRQSLVLTHFRARPTAASCGQRVEAGSRRLQARLAYWGTARSTHLPLLPPRPLPLRILRLAGVVEIPLGSHKLWL